MTNLLERIKSFQRPVEAHKVDILIEMLGQEPSIATLEAVVEHYKAEKKKILGKDLLEWMQENDQTTFETEDFKVVIKTFVSAKIMSDEEGFKWLEAHQYGDMIKDTLAFPKGELTPEAESALEELGLSYTKKSGIHPQTLKKIMSDRLKDGEMLPDGGDPEQGEEIGDGIKINYYDECVVKEK